MRQPLLAILRHRANRHGLAIAREAQLLPELETTRDEVTAALDAMTQAHLVEVLSPLPFLVVRFLKWSGRSSTERVESPAFTSASSASSIDVPVSSSHAAAAAASSKQEDGGAGEGEVLLDEAIRLLGPETDRDEFRDLLARFRADVVRQALSRVAATPTAQIRKSKVALFRYLLIKLS